MMEKVDPLRATIEWIRSIHAITQEQMAAELGVTPNTLSHYKKDPAAARLKFLREIDRRYGLTDEEIVRIVRGR